MTTFAILFLAFVAALSYLSADGTSVRSTRIVFASLCAVAMLCTTAIIIVGAVT